MATIKNFYTFYGNAHTAPIATLLVLHGMQEHSGRYAAFANYVSNNGIAVITYDHKGHGHTAKSEEEQGYFYKTHALQQLIEDAMVMAGELERLYPNIPHFIMGHSMGSFITRCVLQQYSSRFAGAVLMGTGASIPGMGIGKQIMKVVTSIAPTRRSRFLNGAFTKINNARFKNETPQDGLNWLSVDIENRNAFRNDPLCGVPFTNNGFYTLFTIIAQATKNHWAQPISKNFPMLFISGQEDPIGDYGKGVEKTVAELRQAGFAHIAITLYKDMRHEILNEGIKETVYGDIINWIQGSIPAT